MSGLSAQKRKNKKDTEPPTQVLPPLPDPPDAIAADTARLSFQVSPLSNKGLLSQQIRDALKALLRDNHGAQIVKLRAFVAGSGDLRRVQQIVVDEFTDRKMTLPVISTIQVGALPMVGAQVVMEATSVEKRAVNPNAVIFLPSAEGTDPAGPVGYLRQRAKTNEMLRVTCFLSSLEDTASTQAAATAAFPGAAVDIVQPQRQSLRSYAACEGVARQTDLNPRTIAGSFASKQQVLDTVKMMGYYTQSPKIIFTSTKLVFREEDADVRLAFQRLEKAMEPLGAKPQDIFWTSIYALTNPVGAKTATLEKDFVGPNAVGPGASMLFEGLPSTDATAAIEIIAVGH